MLGNFDFNGFEFLSPIYFLLLLIIPLFVFFELKKRNNGIQISFFDDLRSVFPRFNFLFWTMLSLKVLIIGLFVVILANPNLGSSKQKISKEGIDIIIDLDISTSMLAEDIKPNRLEGAKKVISQFAEKLETDRLGILLFAGKPFVSSPLTFDYGALVEYIKNISTDTINQNVYGLNGTAIGDALLMSISSITKEDEKRKKEKKKVREKVIILLSDGEANRGAKPLLAATMAKDKKIKVYTIGIGDPNGTIMYTKDFFGRKVPQRDMYGNAVKSSLDEKTLRAMAEMTGGQYFNASDNNTFQKIFEKLALLEKSEVKTEIIKEYTPKYKEFLYILILLILILLGLKSTYKVIG